MATGQNKLSTCGLSRTAGLPGGMGSAPGPRGATEPPKISQHKLFEFRSQKFWQARGSMLEGALVALAQWLKTAPLALKMVQEIQPGQTPVTR